MNMQTRSFQLRKSDFFCSLGISANFTWCILEAHSPSFASALTNFSASVNPRLFWLLGATLMALCFLVIPQIIKKSDHLFRLVIPLLSTLGTACFAISYSQHLTDPFTLAMFGLLLSGLGFGWFIARYILLMARVKLWTTSVFILVGAILIKTLLLIIIYNLIPFEAQMYVALLIPLINTFIFEFARSSAGKELSQAKKEEDYQSSDTKKHTVFGLPTQPRRLVLTKGGQNNLIALMVMGALLLAIVRRLGFLGLWVEVGAASPQMWQFSELFVVAVLLIPFAYFTLIATKDISLAFRFQPAIIVVMAILIFMSFDLGGNSVLSELQFLVIHVGEAFAYVLGYSIVLLALDALDKPPFRVLGTGGLAFSLFSLFWVIFFENSITLNGAIILTVAYLLLIATMVLSFVESKRYLKLREAALNLDDQIHMREYEGSKPRVNYYENSLISNITHRCNIIANQFKLSPRETEIFCLLSQGRTRSYIQEELSLSDGTVKTHISHVYSKLGVGDRQSMMDIVLMEAIEGSSKE